MNSIYPKWTEYKTALEQDADIYLSQDVNISGAKQYTALNITQALSLIEKDNHINEILKNDRPMKIYLDFDCKKSNIRDFVDEIGPSGNIKKEITNIIEGMVEDFIEEFDIFDDVSKLNRYILDASNDVKFSFHFSFDLKLNNFTEADIFHKKFISFTQETYNDNPEYHNLHKYIDPNVYSKNRNWRLINQSKYGQNRPFKIYSGSNDVKDYFISYFNKDIPTIKIPKSWVKSYENKMKKIDTLKGKIPTFNKNNQKIFDAIIPYTLHKTNEYSDWVKWIWALCGSGIDIDTIKYYSREGCPEKYDEKQTENIINEYNPEKSNLGLHSLKFWAKENGYDIDRDYEKVEPLTPIKRNDNFTYGKLVYKYSNNEYESISDLENDMFNDVNKVVSQVSQGSGVFVICENDNNPFKLTKNLQKLTAYYKNDDGKKVKFNLQEYMQNHPEKYPIYDKIVFKPDMSKVKPFELNICPDYQAKEISNPDYSCISRLLFHIKEVLANGDEYIYRYILSWMCKIIQTPDKPTDIFLLLHGKQGSGKTLMAQFLIDYVFGWKLSGTSKGGISSLVGKFNSSVQGKLFICCNELTSIDTTKNSFNASFDQLKSLITDRTIQVEPKGIDSYTIQNYCNFMGTTNHIYTTKIEQGDRRYACFTVSDKFIGNREYFNQLINECFNQDCGDMFYTYLKNYPNNQKVDILNIPMTDIRKSMINSSKHNVDNFMNDVVNGCVNIYPHFWLDIQNNEISIENIYNLYRQWCLNTGEKIYTMSVFSRMMPNEYIQNRGRKQKNGKRIRYIQLINCNDKDVYQENIDDNITFE